MKNVLTVTTFILLIAFPAKVFSQKTIQEVNELSDKKFEKLITVDRAGYGYLKTFIKQDQMTAEQLPELNEIALLTFILFDDAISSRADAYNQGEVYGHVKVTTNISESGGQRLANVFYDISLPGIKRGLGDRKLLTPTDYLNSEEEKSAYRNAEIKPTGLIGAVDKAMGRDKDMQANAVPESYQFHFATFASPDVKLSRSVGELASKVGVESFLSAQVSVKLHKGKLYLTSIKMALHVPNPAPYDENIKYRGFGPTKGYWEGICLASMTFTPKKELQIARLKKGNLEEESYEGMDKISERMTQQMMAHVKEEMEGLK